MATPTHDLGTDLRAAFRRDHPEYFAGTPTTVDCWTAIVALRDEITTIARCLERVTDSLLELHHRLDVQEQPK